MIITYNDYNILIITNQNDCIMIITSYRSSLAQALGLRVIKWCMTFSVKDICLTIY